MKKQLVIIPLFLLFSFSFYAQVGEDKRSMSQGNHTAYMIDIPNTNEKFVENIWKKYLRSYGGKSKNNRGSKEIYTSNAKISAIGKGDRVDLYTIFEQSGDDVSLSMWVDLGDEFLSKSNKNSQVQGAKDFLEDFAGEVRREIIRLQVKEEGEKLEKFVVNMRRLERDSIRFEREIEMAETKILKNQEKLEENRIAREDLLHIIEVQQITLDSVKSLQHN
jgi:hypothetical protein